MKRKKKKVPYNLRNMDVDLYDMSGLAFYFFFEAWLLEIPWLARCNTMFSI